MVGVALRMVRRRHLRHHLRFVCKCPRQRLRDQVLGVGLALVPMVELISHAAHQYHQERNVVRQMACRAQRRRQPVCAPLVPRRLSRAPAHGHGAAWDHQMRRARLHKAVVHGKILMPAVFQIFRTRASAGCGQIAQHLLGIHVRLWVQCMAVANTHAMVAHLAQVLHQFASTRFSCASERKPCQNFCAQIAVFVGLS